jgi:hypothetical protein
MSKQFQPEFEERRRECALIDREMGQIVGAPLSVSEDERQVRKSKFASPIERRNAAAGKFLSSRGVIRRVRPSIKQYRLTVVAFKGPHPRVIEPVSASVQS